MTASDANDVRRYVDKAGCPVCARVKKFERDLLGGDAIADVSGLCNFHAWALAKSASASTAAGLFLSALHHAAQDEGLCPFCSHLSEMEGESIAALRQLLTQPKDREWMHHYGRLCLSHARKLEGLLDDEGRKTIHEIVQRIREELDRELASLLRNSSAHNSSGGGALGRAAEFLASQRGLDKLNGEAEKRK